MKKKNEARKKGGLFQSRKFVFVFSLVLATLSWIIVAGFISPGETKRISNVPIDYQRNEEEYKEKSLQIVGEITDLYADVLVSGDGAQIGPLTNTSVTVYPDYSNVNGPGPHEVPLRATKLDNSTFDIMEWTVKSPNHSLTNNPKNTVTLTFEEIESKSFPITVKADGITATSGYFRDTPMATPAEVMISGPRTEVERIAQVVAEVTEEEERSERKIYQRVPLTLLDVNNNEIDQRQLNLTFSNETVEVDIAFLEIRNVGLTADFAGLPQYFDLNWFSDRVHLSVDSVQLVGTSAAFDSISDPYPITTFDVSELELGWESKPIIIELPENSGLKSMDQLRQVVVSFDTTDLVEKTIEVENIRVINGPVNAEIEPVGESINVRLIGPEDQINALLPENITIQVDAFGVSAAAGGQQTIPARVLIPSANRVIAIGSYTVICDVILPTT